MIKIGYSMIKYTLLHAFLHFVIEFILSIFLCILNCILINESCEFIVVCTLVYVVEKFIEIEKCR